MNERDLKPAGELAKRYGVKSILYGKAGTGKTPLINTAPRPVLLVVEPGLLSMRASKIPAYEAPTRKQVEEFFKWFFGSAEARKFDTLAIDSISQVAEIILEDEKRRQKHGMKAYGAMSESVIDLANKLFYMPQKHIVLIAKNGYFDNGKQTVIQGGEVITETVKQARPFFPGQDLNVRMPHLFDNVLHLGEVSMPGFSKPVKALRTVETSEIFARSRSGTLNELEEPNLTALFNKAMS